MVYLDTNYWKDGVILKFRVFTENFQLILEMRREKVLDGVNFHKFNNLLICILMGIPWDGTGMNFYAMGWDKKICPMDKPGFNSMLLDLINNRIINKSTQQRVSSLQQIVSSQATI